MKKFAFLLSIGIIYCISLKAQDSLQHYVAKYKFPQGSMVTEVDVVMENGVLMVNSTMGSAAIERSTGDEFTVVFISVKFFIKVRVRIQMKDRQVFIFFSKRLDHRIRNRMVSTQGKNSFML